MKHKPQLEISPSSTAHMHQLALDKKAQGIKVYNLAAGDAVLCNHPSITRGGEQAIASKNMLYAPIAGTRELRLKATEWINSYSGANYALENTMVTCGGKFALFMALQALIKPGDEVLIPAPYWVSYPEMVKLFGGIPKLLPTSEKEGWKVTPAMLQNAITAKTKALIFNNGCNPTGVVYTQKELQTLVEASGELFLLSDEVYSALVYDGQAYTSLASFAEARGRMIVVQSCSKNFGMSGWRVGFAFAPPAWIEALTTLQGQSTSGVSPVNQSAALAALENVNEVTEYVRGIMQQRRDLFMQTYRTLFDPKAIAPTSALYYFAKIPQGISSLEFCERALQEANVALVPGSAFGVEGYVRFAYSVNEEDIVAALHSLHGWMQSNAY